MSPARGLVNQKLYHSAILQRLLAAELSRQEIPQAALLEAVGESVQGQLRDAYGWFMLELAGAEAMPSRPPRDVSQLIEQQDLQMPLSGELVELLELEQRVGWLAQLLASETSTLQREISSIDNLASAASRWTPELLQLWHQELTELIDRMSHSLEEW